MDIVKFNLSLGAVRIEYEGPPGFVEETLKGFIEDLAQIEVQDAVVMSNVEASDIGGRELTIATSPVSKLSTSDFAVKMGVKSGTDLVMAAAASLHHTKASEDFRRGDILNEMKSARAFYKASYGSNLSKSLDTLIKTGRLQNPRSDTYALPYAEIENTRRLL